MKNMIYTSISFYPNASRMTLFVFGHVTLDELFFRTSINRRKIKDQTCKKNFFVYHNIDKMLFRCKLEYCLI